MFCVPYTKGKKNVFTVYPHTVFLQPGMMWKISGDQNHLKQLQN